MALIVDNLNEFGSNLEKYLLQLKIQKRFRLSQIVILLIIIILEFIEYKSFRTWTKTYTTLESTKFFSNDKAIVEFFGYKSYDAFVIAFTSIVLVVNYFFFTKIWGHFGLVKSLLCLDVLLTFIWISACITNILPARHDGVYQCTSYAFGDSEDFEEICRSYLIAVHLGYLMTFSYIFVCFSDFRMIKIMKHQRENYPEIKA